MARKNALRSKVVFVVLSPVLFAVLLVLLALFPFYLGYRMVLRLLVELLWGRHGRRILLVYSRSPVWQEYIETHWLPRLCDQAVVLDWSDRARWNRRNSFAVWVFLHWAPYNEFNPMAVLFPRLARVRRVLFYKAFRDWKNGRTESLRSAEEELFSFAEGARRPSA